MRLSIPVMLLLTKKFGKFYISLTREKCRYTGRTISAERSKTLLDTDLKIILLDHQNNFVGTLKIMSKNC